MSNEFKSRVYTDRPSYADLDSPEKFQAIQGIIATRLRQHPKAICSYSGGADSDILIDIIERTRKMFGEGYLPPVKYIFFNTGLEMKATKDHVKATAEKYGVEIEECRPKINIVTAVRKFGMPFMSKAFSVGIGDTFRKNVPLSVIAEYESAEDKPACYERLKQKYPRCSSSLTFLCSCNRRGEPGTNMQLSLNSQKYMDEFLQIYPPDFKISKRCCDYCKKEPAHRAQKDYEMIITGEREAEDGIRTIKQKDDYYETNTMCFFEQSDGKYRFKPLYYVSNKDKEWYKQEYGIRYSDAYEVYGLTRTGCCGCPISHKAVDDLEKIRPYEPNVVKAAYNLFGKSYEYRRMFNEYKAKRKAEEKAKKQKENQQLSLFDEKENEQ